MSTRPAELHPWLFAGGCALVLNAGFMNTVAYLGFYNKFVSHMTGNVAQIGVGESPGGVLQPLLLIVCFVLGATANGLLIGTTNFSLSERYGLVLGLQAVLLAIASVGFDFGAKAIHLPEYLVAAVCGMQNSMTTIYSGAVIRTTHLTGALTDLGSEIGHWLRGDRAGAWRIGFFTASVMSFAIGSGLAVVGFGRLGLDALWASVALYAGLALAVTIGRRTTSDAR